MWLKYVEGRRLDEVVENLDTAVVSKKVLKLLLKKTMETKI